MHAPTAHPADRAPRVASRLDSPSPAVAAAARGGPEGERNDTLYRYASSLRSRDLSGEKANVLVHEFAKDCKSPLPKGGAMRALDSAW
jgi:hypothetical protein